MREAASPASSFLPSLIRYGFSTVQDADGRSPQICKSEFSRWGLNRNPPAKKFLAEFAQRNLGDLLVVKVLTLLTLRKAMQQGRPMGGRFSAGDVSAALHYYSEQQ